MSLAAGKLDRRIKLQRLDEVRAAGSGEVTEVPVDVATVWAQMEPLSGSELYQAGQMAAKVDTVFRIRHRRDVTPKMQIIDETGRIFNVQAVLEIGRREGLELHAEARAE